MRKKHNKIRNTGLLYEFLLRQITADVLNKTEKSKALTIVKNRFNEHAEGLGVCVTTGYGDGEYPVYAEIEDGVVKSVTIKFV